MSRPHPDIDLHNAEADNQQSQIPRMPSPSLSENTESTAAGSTLEEQIGSIYQNHDKLKEMGGRPSASINPDPGVCPPSKSDIDKQYHTSDHWNREGLRVHGELTRWMRFREYQQDVRTSQERFKDYINGVYEYQQEAGIEWTITLQLQPDQQTKLDEWMEYYIYESRRHHALKTKADRILQMPKEKQPFVPLALAEEELRWLGPALEWIRGQIPAIAAECALSTRDNETPNDHLHHAAQPTAVRQPQGATQTKALRKRKRRSPRQSASRQANPDQTLAKAVLDQKARVTKRRGAGKSGSHSAFPALRRSTRIRKQPDRFS